MANKTKAEDAEATADIARMGFSIAEFRASYGFSEGFYRKLRKEGKGPREMRLGRRVIISATAIAEWEREREREAAM
ncbi:hypothetical protein [Bradyrhizobium sp. WSM1743]|uniref:hypothetical protein n=1 Tax=Bradyrhizobium sp. WSM1743 TaxID=318996 RepID=UPI000426BD35|nr:hypothetical protein [Bradyrhizobium sp. WSM1743]